jgi:RimJ/RimL family protein N-acetyltransferase
MQTPEPVTLTGPVVRLEPLAEHHRDDLAAAVAADPAAFRVSGPGAEPSGIDGWMQTALAAMAARTRLPFTVIHLGEGRAIGSSSYMDIVAEDDRVEIGHTWYGGPWQGTAVNPAAKLLLLGHAFDVLRAQRVALRCDARNEQSRRAIARLGAQFEGVLRSYGWRIEDPTQLRDTASYSILDREWPAVREGLEARLDRAG